MLKLYYIFGIFPCNKGIFEGKCILTVSKGIHHLFKYLVTIVMTYIPHYILIIFVANNQNESFLELMHTKSIMNSTTNIITMLTTMACIYYQHFVMIICLWKIRFQLCDHQDLLQEKSFNKTLSSTTWYDWGLRIIIALFLVTDIIIGLGMTYPLTNNPANNKFLNAFLVFSTSCIIFITDSPIICFLITLVNIFKMTYNWIKSLQKITLEENICVWQETQDFLSQWRKLRSVLSFPILTLVVITLINSVLVLYRGISFFTDDCKDTSLILIFAGYISIGMTLAFTLGYINFYAQMINEEVAELTEQLHQYSSPDEFNGNLANHQTILRSLSLWKGFTGYEFFTLGKPLLASIVSAFMTYMIVLAQFQTSQN